MEARAKLPEGVSVGAGMIVTLAVVIGLLAVLVVYFSSLSGHSLDEGAQAAQMVSLVSVIVALGALIYGGRQLKISREQQDRNFAEELYRDYLRLAFDNPILASPRSAGLGAVFDYEKQTINVSSGNFDAKLLYAKYDWFLSFVLDACEQLYKKPLRIEYDATVQAQLWYHRDWLRHQWKKREHGQLGLIKDDEYLLVIRKTIAIAIMELARTTFQAHPTDPEQRNLIKQELLDHRGTLADVRNNDPAKIEKYGLEVGRLVEEILLERPVTIGAE
jgi:hypothetical protein